MGNKLNYFFHRYKKLLALSLIGVLAMGLIAGAVLLRQRQIFFTRADAPQAKLFLVPPAQLSASMRLALWVTVNQSLAFVQVELSFDPQIFKLTAVDVSDKFDRVVNITTVESANQTGKVKLVLAVSPAQLAQAPKGTFRLADIILTPAALDQPINTKIDFTPAIQLVDTKADIFIVTTNSVSLNFNDQPPTANSTFDPALCPAKCTASGIRQFLMSKCVNLCQKSAASGLSCSEACDQYGGWKSFCLKNFCGQ